jgi:hypothetical protein
LYILVIALRTSAADGGVSFGAACGSSCSSTEPCGCAASGAGGCSIFGCSGGLTHAHANKETIMLNKSKLILPLLIFSTSQAEFLKWRPI